METKQCQVTQIGYSLMFNSHLTNWVLSIQETSLTPVRNRIQPLGIICPPYIPNKIP
jgi:hypothetical protein